MTKQRIIIIIAAVVVGLVLLEIFNLLELKASTDRYASYWRQQASAHGAYTYVALGDSAAQGIGASQPQLGYVGLLARQIAKETGKTVRVINLSVSGAKIQDVIDRQLPELQHYNPDLLTVEVGSNDVTHWNQKTFASQYDALAKALPKGTLVANVPYFGGRIRLNAQAITASQLIGESADRYHLKVVDLQTYTRQRQSILNYSSDLFHPSNRSYRNWAAAFWQVIQTTNVAGNR